MIRGTFSKQNVTRFLKFNPVSTSLMLEGILYTIKILYDKIIRTEKVGKS